MQDKNDKSYIKLGVTGVAVIVISLLCFFLLFRLKDVFAGLGIVTAILTPFLYGVVIAYVLTPICGRIERAMKKFFPRVAGALSILLSLLLAFAVVWALVMLVFPQVWSSIVSIANAIPEQLASANDMLHNLLQNQPQLQIYWDEFSTKTSPEIIH